MLIIGGSIANFTNVAATFKVKLFLETLLRINFTHIRLILDQFASFDHANWQLLVRVLLMHLRSNGLSRDYPEITFHTCLFSTET